jgi:hypothetical protein
MSEQGMAKAVQEGLAREGIEDTVIAAGQFSPRGHSGSMFVGGLAGNELGGVAGAAGAAVGGAAGIAGGVAANSVAAGMPTYMLVGVGETGVYGFEGTMSKAGRFVFQVPREGLKAEVHQRIDVKVLELIEPGGSQIELEGNRLPLTHSKDVIAELTG